ncbi:MAG: type II toxin-antitoxin system CcdA family antitoxin [Candidatus Bathyarchaeota archaeon]|nr:type II toxin-antitoxin system CcdA family antitoxin [Candidatus Bathyarchaeota archaeon]MDH5733395.1 type II toxin-antitoxin system CcdA family antitoxin [Candidatus Bathyarchaeota archaeon]
MAKKKLVSIKVDEKIHKEAKELGLNISKTCENALKEAVRKLKGEPKEAPE